MKSLEALYKEVMESEDLKKGFLEAAKSEETLKAFLKNHSCDVGLEELQTFIKEKAVINVSDEDIDSVAGGKSGEDMIVDVMSSITVIGCVIGPVMSEVNKSAGRDTRCVLED